MISQKNLDSSKIDDILKEVLGSSMPNVPITEIGKTPRIVSNEMGKATLHEIISRPSTHKVRFNLLRVIDILN